MKAKNISGGLGGFAVGDRIILPKWNGLAGGMTGSVARAGRYSLRVQLDNGDSVTIESRGMLEALGARPPRKGEDW